MSKQEKWLLACLVVTLTVSVVYDATVTLGHDKATNKPESSIVCPDDRGFDGKACQENKDG